jgi:predicted MPP superfamily phosphohydrolase
VSAVGPAAPRSFLRSRYTTMLRRYVLILLLHGYIALRLVPALPGGFAAIAALLAWLAASAILMPLGFAARRIVHDRGTSERIAWAGLIAMGAFSSLIVLTWLRDIVLLVAAVLPGTWLSEDAASVLRTWTAAAVPSLAALFTLIGFVNARRRARVRRVEVPIDGLPPALDGFTIAQISDLHVGPTIRRGYVEAVVDAVNGLAPDLIAVTGDLVDGGVPQLASHTAPLSKLSARHGTYFVTGNHEYYSGVNAWLAELTRLGLHVLLNEHIVVHHDGADMVIAGVTDYGAHHFHPSHRSDPAVALRGAPHDVALRVLLAHQPRSAFAAERAGYDLQLSGHTHGGQFLPWTFLVRFWQPFTAGLHRLGRLWVYVSRGTGYWGPPKRLGAPSEITQLRLVAA